MYIHLHGLAQPQGPLPQPVLPGPPPVPMPTNPLPPKKWCPTLGQMHSKLCFPYQADEVAVSRTAAGHVTPDVVVVPSGVPAPNVVIACRYLIIRDFGVDWRHVKLAARSETLFKNMLSQFETDNSLLFRIVGYNDCVGVERNNFLLRRGRARNVFNLLGPGARSRVIAATAAPANTFLTDNSTVIARANTRAVVIEFFVNGQQTL